ncbi:molybdenum cofactor biosynthetic protein (CnxF), putative [Talaromyces stipitatus ATCC 10500]|uniref:Adenylyltransferase and sulfurtransferase uba4 n=1 Tax=Talaromyces stipitatus (strain ATCC 10500 / CBS 375.48 / QM 6759 / NRRL 1006) TaxID=441959 RepID=B8MCF4_TALSN|nr:molybdenum cofactor biosynthetic protein (CnxF), putative [Talaromyces stipitatus ATCC 10500]EED18770.1 molybdenum cofactor biosynthetic protein (CnxF), putative [Talaromyces stipitatus ATCC 10500]
MEDIDTKCTAIRAQITATESQLAALKEELEAAERLRGASAPTSSKHSERKWPLSAEEYQRYGRQMIVSQIGLPGQLKLRSASVLLVGAGGLGCPAALYLAGAGVGTVGMVDGDTVEASNLHRQVLHRTKNVGKYKVDSAIEYLEELNPHPKYCAHREHLSPQNAPGIFQNYDIILDCTDNPATRYLISDTAVLLGKPLVTASALRTDGQLMVLNNPPKPPGDLSGGPCYRCVFPKPPPADTVVSCADGGILGPVVGTMGVLQALETIKVLVKSVDQSSDDRPSLHIFSAYSNPPFRTIRLRGRRTNCAVCSSEPTITLSTLQSGSTDYVQFCGSARFPQVLSKDERVSVREFEPIYDSKKYSLIDVRDPVQFGICNLENSINIPITQILQDRTFDNKDPKETLRSLLPPELTSTDSTDPIYFVCRMGNDSQLAVQKLRQLGFDQDGRRFIGDIRGGLKAWKAEVDPEWPEY